VYIVGIFLAEAIWQSREYWQSALNGRPLIQITEALTAEHRVWPQIIAFPWLMLVGLPLLTKRGRVSYWDLRRFYLRLVAFAVVEVTLLTVALIAMAAPALQILKSLPPIESEVATTVTHWTFWLFALLIGLLMGMRWWQTRREAEA